MGSNDIRDGLEETETGNRGRLRERHLDSLRVQLGNYKNLNWASGSEQEVMDVKTWLQ